MDLSLHSNCLSYLLSLSHVNVFSLIFPNRNTLGLSLCLFAYVDFHNWGIFLIQAHANTNNLGLTRTARHWLKHLWCSFASLPSGQMYCPLQFPRTLNIFLLHRLPDGSKSIQLTVFIHMFTSYIWAWHKSFWFCMFSLLRS